MDKKTEDEMDGTGLIYWLVNRDYVGFPETQGAFVRAAMIRNIVYSGFTASAESDLCCGCGL